MCCSLGIETVFNIPRSPYYNTIELFWGNLKTNCKKLYFCSLLAFFSFVDHVFDFFFQFFRFLFFVFWFLIRCLWFFFWFLRIVNIFKTLFFAVFSCFYHFPPLQHIEIVAAFWIVNLFGLLVMIRHHEAGFPRW